MGEKQKVALVIGRFQPMHLGHLHAIKDILKANSSLILIIGSSQAKRTEKNPFSSFERKEMIVETLRKEGLLSKTKILLLEDQNHHENWTKSVIKICKPATRLYSGNWLVQHLLRPHMEVHTMKSDVKISATMIRKLISAKIAGWKKFVPAEVANYLIKNKLLGVVK
ncbi:adenylyltransferase/cytidyltransferase family protein [Candidatus Micrarchaeota archaeon]|nr:adenylyltransferase/cytidyltransferase family protein [Candidatus Micrarchaeota archaeon]